MYYLKYALFWTLYLTLCSAYGADYDIFIGEYEGIYISDRGKEFNRDLSVQITAVDDGFNVAWKTTTFKKDKPKEKSYSIDFIKTDREHIYEAAQKKNLFGGRDPLDPMQGDPYFWARIEDNKLTVFAMIVTDNGGYEMQTFDRVLQENKNLQLRYHRVRDGEALRTIEAELIRK